MPGPNEISPQNLMRLLGGPDAPQLIDVRLAKDRTALPTVIPTAQSAHHAGVAEIVTADHVVVICHKGMKLSHGAAALLRAQGIRAEVLAGGHVGWCDAGLPVTDAAALPASPRWVTRQRPKIDRIACPWLIRRFVDPAAEFLFVPARDVAQVATRFDATPFDIPDVPFSHVGDACSFDAMIAHFGLGHPALDRLALIVRAADTDRHDLAPQAAGLLALSVGLSRLYRDDNAQLDAAMGLYDALYRWARDGVDEGHAWPDGALA